MFIELTFAMAATVIICAFLFEYMNSSLGMGFGTALTPVLLILGFKPLEIVPAILLSELVTGSIAGIFHHRKGNVNFRPKTTNTSIIIKKIRSLGFLESFRRGLPQHLRTSLLLGFCSIIGTIAAVLVAINISTFWLNLYIGCIVTIMGLIILINLNRSYSFSMGKIVSMGLIASFNKGISGGGYGPLVTGGQILAGVETKNAVGITSFAKGLTCAVGAITYFFIADNLVDWKLAPYVIIGAVLSVPFAATSVKKINTKKLKLIIAIFTLILGLITLTKIFKF